MAGYRDALIKRVKAHYEAEGYKVDRIRIEDGIIRIEDGIIYIDCGRDTFKENLDEWLKDLLKEQDFSVTITERDTNKPIFKAVGCRVVSWSSGVSDLRLEIAVRAEDEFADALGGDSEADGSTSLEDGT